MDDQDMNPPRALPNRYAEIGNLDVSNAPSENSVSSAASLNSRLSASENSVFLSSSSSDDLRVTAPKSG